MNELYATLLKVYESIVLMVRFGKNCIYDERLSFFGKLSYFIHSNPHIAKFLQSHYFVKHTKKIMSKKIKNVLDIGCGNGDYSFYLAEKYPWLQIDAIDIDEQNIIFANQIKAKKRKLYANIRFGLYDFKNFKTDKRYDYICCVEMLHSILDKDRLIKKTVNLLAKDGFFYFQDCMNGDYVKTILSFPVVCFNKYRECFFSGKQFRSEELIDALKKQKLEIVKTKRIIGFFGQLAWEIDQILQSYKIKYVRTLAIPFLKLLCVFEFAVHKGRKNELSVITRK